MNEIFFENRIDAGEKLAKEIIQQEPELENPIVLGIPRGGVPIGYVLTKKLGGELDTIVLRKIPIPQDPEAGYGAVTLDKTVILNKELLSYIHLTKEEMEDGIEKVYQEVLRRNKVYRKGKPFPNLKERSVILTDDGLASGYTMLAAVEFCKKKKPKQIIVAVPVASDSAAELIEPEVDRFILLHKSYSMYFAVASFYERFEDLKDKEVVEILEKARKEFSTDETD